MFKLITLQLLVFFMSMEFGIGQIMPEDSLSVSSAKNYTIQYFLQSMKESSPVYQGHEFIPYNKNIKGSPFFLHSEPLSGILEFNGIAYPEIVFAYDMVSDKVVIKNYSNEYMMIAPTEKIRRFDLGDHSFFRPEADIKFRGLEDTGFYEILNPGKTMVVAKKSKIVQYIQGEDNLYLFRSYNIFYVYDQEIFREINSQKELLSLFKTREGEVRKFILAQNLNFKKDKENTIVEATKFYDQLTK
ncbi:MAG: hypothetical protein ACRC2O_09485 [Chitinophagaceae bacterium]